MHSFGACSDSPVRAMEFRVEIRLHIPFQIRSTAQRIDAPPPLRFWHLASLDAPTVAVVWSLAFAWAAHTLLAAWVPVLLALGTFAVYVGDRLLDARAALCSGNPGYLRDRHWFHWRHCRVLALLAAAAAAVAAVLSFALMPAAIRQCDSVLAAAALAYFSGVHAQRRQIVPRFVFASKELLVGILFASGCAAPTLSRMHFAANPRLWPLLAAFAFFAALAWLNCCAIERWESGDASHVSAPAVLLFILGLLLADAFTRSAPRIAVLLIAGAAAVLLLTFLDGFRTRLTPLALRTAADFVLLTPLALLTQNQGDCILSGFAEGRRFLMVASTSESWFRNLSTLVSHLAQ